MSIENTAIEPTAEVTTEVEGIDSDVSEENSAEESSGAEESFDQWLARKEKESSKSKEPKQEVAEKKETKKEVKEEQVVEKKEEVAKIENEVKAAKIKIKEKEYELAELEKSIEELEISKQQIQQMYSEMNEFLNRLKNNPSEMFDKLEISKDGVEEWYYNKYLLSPEEQESRALKMDAERYREHVRQQEEERQRAAEREKQEKEAKEQEAAKEHYQKLFTQKIQESFKEHNVPENQLTIMEATKYIKEQFAKKEPVSPKELATRAKGALLEFQKSILTQLEPESMAEYFGDDVMVKLRNADAKKFEQKKLKEWEQKQPTKGVTKKTQDKKEPRRNVYDIIDDINAGKL